MTAIPDDTDTPRLLLICDNCGRTERGERTHPDAWTMLWLRAQIGGWQGRGRAVGPHYCPGCRETP